MVEIMPVAIAPDRATGEPKAVFEMEYREELNLGLRSSRVDQGWIFGRCSKRTARRRSDRPGKIGGQNASIERPILLRHGHGAKAQGRLALNALEVDRTD